MAEFDTARYDTQSIRRHAERFDSQVFQRQITSYVDQAWEAFQQGRRFVWQNPVPQEAV
jgi:hypothetical protein